MERCALYLENDSKKISGEIDKSDEPRLNYVHPSLNRMLNNRNKSFILPF